MPMRSFNHAKLGLVVAVLSLLGLPAGAGADQAVRGAATAPGAVAAVADQATMGGAASQPNAGSSDTAAHPGDGSQPTAAVTSGNSGSSETDGPPPTTGQGSTPPGGQAGGNADPSGPTDGGAATGSPSQSAQADGQTTPGNTDQGTQADGQTTLGNTDQNAPTDGPTVSGDAGQSASAIPAVADGPGTGDFGLSTRTTSGRARQSGNGNQGLASPPLSADGSLAGEPSPAAGESSSTTQLIWQLQTSACLIYCQGLTQTQTASQQNTTVQTLEGLPVGAAGSVSGDGLQTATSTTQIQVGCVAHCSGTTTVTTQATIPALIAQTVERLLASLLPPDMADARPTPAGVQSTVDQTSLQTQDGRGSSATQSQAATQSSITIQSVDLATSLASSLQAALGSTSSAPTAASQTSQGIWQVQIGCLIFCTQTQQLQQAQQLNTTVAVIDPGSAPVDQTAASVVSSVSQVVWQVQVGCLLWCNDSTEQQTASSTSTLDVIDGNSAAPTAPKSNAPSNATPPAGNQSRGANPTAQPSQASGAGPTTLPEPTGGPAGSGEQPAPEGPSRRSWWRAADASRAVARPASAKAGGRSGWPRPVSPPGRGSEAPWGRSSDRRP